MAGQKVRVLQRRELERLLTSAAGKRLLEGLAAELGSRAMIMIVVTPATTSADEHQLRHRVPPCGSATVRDRGRRNALIYRRREVCKTQEGLATEVGVLRSTVARWESGHTTPSLWARPRVARALDVTLDRLDELLGAASDTPRPMAQAGDLNPGPSPQSRTNGATRQHRRTT